MENTILPNLHNAWVEIPAWSLTSHKTWTSQFPHLQQEENKSIHQ